MIWVQRWEATGSIVARPSGGSVSPLEDHAEFLLGLVAEQPDLTLDEIVAAMGWPLMTNQLRALNFPIGETIPKENTTGWIDHLMITAASERKDLAAEFLEYMIEAKTQKAVSDVTGYDPANPQAGELMTPDQRKSLHLDDVNQYMTRIYFWQQVLRREKYNEIWNEVKAAQ